MHIQLQLNWPTGKIPEQYIYANVNLTTVYINIYIYIIYIQITQNNTTVGGEDKG